MELRLFLVGLVAYVFAKTSKYLKDKKVFAKKTYFIIWALLFTLLAGGLTYFLLDFMASNGIEGGVSFKTKLLLAAATIALGVYEFIKAFGAEGVEVDFFFNFNLDWAETVYFAAFFASFVMFFFMQAFQIPTGSMRNTLIEKDNLFVNKIVYGVRLPFMNKRLIKFSDIKRGDIIVFKFPAQSRQQINCGAPQYGRDFVKRVIGLPGETVEIKNKTVYIDGKPLQDEPYAIYEDHIRVPFDSPYSKGEYQQLWEERRLEEAFGLLLRDQFGPVTIPPNTYLGIGDNRDASCDSRFWGPIPEKNIKGKAWFIHWPLSRAGKIK